MLKKKSLTQQIQTITNNNYFILHSTKWISKRSFKVMQAKTMRSDFFLQILNN